MPAFALFCFALALLSTARPALAAELDWQSSLPCDQRHRVVQEVERLIGQPLIEIDSVDFTVTIHALPEQRVELVVETRPRNEAFDPAVRKLVGGSCEELVEAAALAVSMSISGYQAQREAQEPAAVDTIEPPPRAREPVTVSLGAAAALDVGALPGAGLGAQVVLGVRYRWLTVAPLGVFFPRSSTGADSGAGAEFRALAGGLLACARSDHDWFKLGACAGYELGKLEGRGTGLRQPRVGSALWSAARCELQLSLRLLARTFLTASAGATVPTVRERFEIEGGLVHRPSAVTGRFGLGIEVPL